MAEFELKLSDGRVVKWTGTNAQDAARRYVETHRNCKVIATREANRVGIFIGNIERIQQ